MTAPPEIRLRAVDHLGIVVDDLDDAARLLAALGLRTAGAGDAPGVRTAHFELGGSRIELIEFLDEDLRAGRLGDAPARIDHIAFAVADLEEAVEALARLGVETGPAQVSGGRRTCWTVAATTDGVLYQLVESPPSG